LLKAVLINGTRWLEGYDAVAGHPSPPNWNQGFGCLDVRASLPDGSDPLRRLVFRDTHSVPDEQLATVGDAVEYALVTQAQGALRLCLVWTDPPGKRVQNSMAVILQDSPAADWARVGNETRALPDGVGEPATDTYNNVQIIRCDDVPAGTYRLIVVATNKLHGVQPFAVCATGPIAPGALLPALN
jgi:hypothetical protein